MPPDFDAERAEFESPDFKLFTDSINQDEETKISMANIPTTKTNIKEGRLK